MRSEIYKKVPRALSRTIRNRAILLHLMFACMALVLFFCSAARGQGVGINTTTPDPSAALHIQSTNKGLLLPKVSIDSDVDNVSVPSPANALLIYNTNTNLADGIGLYYNRGTPASPSWESVSRLKLPYFHGGSEQSKPLIDIANYYGQSNAVAIKGYAFGTGTGIYAKSDNGSALKVEGGLRIFGNGQSPGAGKVLTSNSYGEATWQGPTAFSASGVKGGGGEVVAPQSLYRIPFASEDYDLGSNYTLHNQSPASTFTAPSDGIYHFDVSVSTAEKNYGLRLMLLRNGVETILHRSESQFNKPWDPTISKDVRLLMGDQVYVNILNEELDHLKLVEANDRAFFSGHLVR